MVPGAGFRVPGWVPGSGFPVLVQGQVSAFRYHSDRSTMSGATSAARLADHQQHAIPAAMVTAAAAPSDTGSCGGTPTSTLPMVRPSARAASAPANAPMATSATASDDHSE